MRAACVLSVACGVVALVLALAPAAAAQEPGAVSEAGDSIRPETLLRAQYYLEPGLEEELKIKVRVWGEVTVPGLYIVGDGADLLEVISLAGGPTQDADLGDVRIVRSFGEESRVIEVDVKDYLDKGSREAIIILEPGDTVSVPSQTWPKIFRWTGVISTLTLIANVMVNASN
jgi:SLBB domain